MSPLLNKTAIPVLARCGATRGFSHIEPTIQNPRSKIQNPRDAFTLVELLVSIAILVLLTAIVLATFQQDDTDRLSASARMLQSYFEGARSRAINDGQVRGVRLIRSQNDPATVDTLAYIGSPELIEGNCELEFVDPFWRVTEDSTTVWNRLVPPQASLPAGIGRSLLLSNAKIEIPAFSGQWYTASVGEDLNGNGTYDPGEDVLTVNTSLDYRVAGDLTLLLRSHYVDSRRTPSGGWEPMIDGAIPYRLALAPTILANTEPVQLDGGIVIDLDASKLPGSWRPNLSPNTQYADSLDILFDDRGSPTGPLVASGLIHLYLTTVQDVELARGQDPVHPQNGTGAPSNNWPFVPARAPIVPKVDPVVLNLFTQGGQVTTSNINPKDDSPADGWADVGTVYSYARRGQEAQ